MKIRHILVATDLSQESIGRTSQVADLARSLGARITLLHVVDAFGAIPHGAPMAPPLQEYDVSKATETASAQLEVQRRAFGPDMDVRADLVIGWPAAERITAYADDNDVDLITVATHGRTGFRHLVLGSVAEAVIRHSRVPVLVLPRTGG